MIKNVYETYEKLDELNPFCYLYIVLTCFISESDAFYSKSVSIKILAKRNMIYKCNDEFKYPMHS